jgi:biopolymer transport protein TolQ
MNQLTSLFSLDADGLSPLVLFIRADIVVQLIMVLLLAASVWVWAIIFGTGRYLGKVRRETEQFERDFWKAGDVDRFSQDAASRDLPAGRVLAAGLSEWRRSTSRPVVDRAGVRERLAIALDSAAASEIDKLGERLNILATIGSVAPFVGLFGTVWGIMNSFTAIVDAGNTSLLAVAPGIAEALFATAVGLFAAIPAVVAYNRMLHTLGRIEARLGRFTDAFHAMLSRELEKEA